MSQWKELPKLQEVCEGPGHPAPGEQTKYQAEYSRASKKSDRAEELLHSSEQRRSEVAGALLLECSSELQEKTEERDPLGRVQTELLELKELARTVVEASHQATTAHEVREDLEEELRGTRTVRDESISQLKKRALAFAAKSSQAAEESKSSPDSRLVPAIRLLPT